MPQDDIERLWEEIEEEDEYTERCSCRYCYCMNETEGGICSECYMGAHQG